MRRDAGSGFRRGLERTGLALGCGCALFAALFVVCGVKLSEPEINGFVGLFHAGKLELTGKHISRYSEDPPKFFLSDREATEEWEALGVRRLRCEGSAGTAILDGEVYHVYFGSFTSRYGRAVFEKSSAEEVKTVVYNDLVDLCLSRYGCEGPIDMGDTFDELNITAEERSDLALALEELYGVSIPTEALEECRSVEDLVGYIEDRL